MRKFHFRLQPVLDQALARQQEVELELGRLREALRRELECLVRLGEARLERQRRLRAASRGRLDLRRLEWERRDLERLVSAVAQQELITDDLQREIERTAEALVQAMRRRQMLENLRDRQHDAHRREMTRLEIRQTDELVTPRFPKADSAVQPPMRQQRV
jgi:flagellar export protein FliJ